METYRYDVIRIDGELDEEGAEYLVLKFGDTNALGAIREYANTISKTRPEFAKDLKAKVFDYYV